VEVKKMLLAMALMLYEAEGSGQQATGQSVDVGGDTVETGAGSATQAETESLIKRKHFASWLRANPARNASHNLCQYFCNYSPATPLNHCCPFASVKIKSW